MRMMLRSNPNWWNLRDSRESIQVQAKVAQMARDGVLIWGQEATRRVTYPGHEKFWSYCL